MRAQVSALCEGVTAAAPAPGPELDAFFDAPDHILARMVRDVLATGDVAEKLKDIMPAIVQALTLTLTRSRLPCAELPSWSAGAPLACRPPLAA